MRKTKTKSTNGNEENGNSTKPLENAVTSPAPPELGNLTQAGNSDKLLQHSEQEAYRSMSLVDTCVTQMSTLIDYAQKECKRDEDNQVRVSPKTIQAAARCASEIRGLIKLKVDFLKEVRKGHE